MLTFHWINTVESGNTTDEGGGISAWSEGNCQLLCEAHVQYWTYSKEDLGSKHFFIYHTKSLKFTGENHGKKRVQNVSENELFIQN